MDLSTPLQTGSSRRKDELRSEKMTADREADRLPSAPSQALLARLYDAYPAWRRVALTAPGAGEGPVFESEMARLGLSEDASILEVGFGEGHFLDWARNKGFAIEGVEISPTYVDEARARGHRVTQGDITDVARAGQAPYDAIVCFDVLEHLTYEQIVEFFAAAHKILKRDGTVLARFPNGMSPFGRLHQYGDVTHLSVLNASSVDQLAFLAGMQVTLAVNAVRPTVRGERYFGLLGRGRELAASLIEWAFGQVYFGQAQPLEPNLVVHLRRRKETG